MSAAQQLEATAAEAAVAVDSREFAALLDARDALRPLRDEFELPRRANDDEPLVYLCGHSLGLQPRGTRALVLEELDAWARFGVDGHFESKRPWWRIEDTVTNDMAELVGALPLEISVMNTLSVNLHLMMVSFYRPTETRYKILIEDKAFPSDMYAVVSQARFHGRSADDAIVALQPEVGSSVVTTEQWCHTIEQLGDSIALVLLPGVQYYTGVLYDMPRVIAAGHARGCTVGLDLAHAAGNVPLALHEWGPDFAVWCTYKYMNSGPGCVAAAFVHERHSERSDLPRFEGWWGHHRESRFKMPHDFVPAPGAAAWALSNPPILPFMQIRGALDLFRRAGMENLREKSRLLTGWMELLLTRHARLKSLVRVITPHEHAQRGSMLCMQFAMPIRDVFRELEARGVVCDLREPDVIRATPAPLYNSFADVFAFVERLALAVDAAAHAEPSAHAVVDSATS